LASRVSVLLVGIALARAEMPQWIVECDRSVATENVGYNQRHHSVLSRGWRRWIEPWYRWDAIWYAELSQSGYTYEPGRPSTSAFLPLLPMIMAMGAALGMDRYVVGLATANVAFVLGLVVFGRMAQQVTGDEQTAWRACLLLVAYPHSLFFSAPYQESLGFALQGAAILAWFNRRPVVSALSLGWASLARLTALAMPVALVAQWATDLARGRPTRHSALLVAAFGFAGIGLFFLYMGWRFGDPLVQLKIQAAWGRKPVSPQNVLDLLGQTAGLMQGSPVHAMVFAAILAWVGQEAILAALAWRASPAAGEAPATYAAARSRLLTIIVGIFGLAILIAAARGQLMPAVRLLDCDRDYLVIVTFLGLGVRAWLKRGPFWGCLVLMPILQGMATGTTMSLPRIALAAFPVFIEAAELLRGRVIFVAVMIALLLAQLKSIKGFVNFEWVV
jgi:hypothetical protein